MQPDGLAAALLKAQAYRAWGDRHPGANAAPARYRAALHAAQLAETLLLTRTTPTTGAPAGAMPPLKEVYLIQGYVQRQLQQWAGSAEAYAEASALDPQDVETWRALGWVAYRAGDYAQALAALGQAATLDPNEPEHYFYQGLVYVAQGERAAAAQAYATGMVAAHAAPGDVRAARLEEALAALRTVQADPANLAGEFMALLKEAQ